MGQSAPRSYNRFSFGTFEADQESYQLRSGSRTLKVERIPLELLFLLLEHSGKLVERGQIVARLWRDHSFLDTERSINTAVRKIRRALGDDTRQPKFIETVIGRGYRFISPVDVGPASSQVQSASRALAAGGSGNSGRNEVRLRDFLIETDGLVQVLSCHVVVGKIELGRLPLAELTLPAEMTLPLRPEDRLLIRFHGIKVSLTRQGTRAIYALSLSALDAQPRARKTNRSSMAQESPRDVPPICSVNPGPG